jgi:GT2 family glycosyltransferase
MERFEPRTFNMGFSREVYEKVGGFRDMYGEDIDLSIRIHRAGFKTKLLHDAYVFHKRRVNLKKFYKQVHIFGQARINLYTIYPDSIKPVHTLPALFVAGSIIILLLSILVSPWLLVLPAFYLLLLFVDSLCKTKKLQIAAISLITSIIQITGYGLGFLNAFIQKIIFRKGLEDLETIKKVYK